MKHNLVKLCLLASSSLALGCADELHVFCYQEHLEAADSPVYICKLPLLKQYQYDATL